MRDKIQKTRGMATMLLTLAVAGCGGGGSSNDAGGGAGGGGGGGGGSNTEACTTAGTSTYDVCVRRTELGIPHVKALRNGDYGSVGYGLGYAFAEDNLCVLMEDLVTIRGERAKFFGRTGIDGRYNGYLIPANGAFANNVDNDFFWKFMATDAAIAPLKAAAAKGSGEAKAATKGYADGFNRYIREIKAGGHAGRHADCRTAPWLAEISENDMYRRYFRLGLLASSSVFVPGIATAQPPGAPALPSGGGGGGGGGLLCAPGALPVIGGQCSPVDPTASAAGKTRVKPLSKASMIAALKRDPGPLAAFQPENKDKFGSNMYALGKNATESGVPMVFGNPHFPWIGTERLYISHITIPGQGDIMGSSLYGVPAVLIGFNRHFAWSHTVSTAFRFTFYELTVNPANPTQYLYDGALRDMTAVPITIKVREDNGDLTDQSRTLYRTHFGPMVGLAVSGANILPWTNLKAYTLRDANAENDRLIQQFFAWNKAQSLEEFKSLHKSILGIPWVNTIASGPGGKAYYGDVTVVPHVTDEQIQTCRAIPLHDVIQQVSPGLPVLDGSRSACEWGTDADAPAPGIFGPGNLPTLERDDYVHNCNDSHWITNPQQPLTGFNRIIGAEGTARSLRTRLCILQAQRHLGEVPFPAGASNFDSDSNKKFDMKELQDTVLSSYIYSAELARDTVTGTICQPGTVLTSAGPVDVAEGCGVLAAWSLTNNLDSKGGHVWREFWRRVVPNPAGVGPNPALWTTAFSATDPVNTPRGLNPLNPQAQRALGEAVTAVEGAGFALDETMGNVQKSGVHTLVGKPDIPIFGGEGSEGAFTIMSGGNITDGYRVIFGNSYIQTVTWDQVNGTSGHPIAEGFITYSQSTDPANPHFRSFTERYSAKQWKRFPFTDAEIAADQVGDTLRLQQ